ncbi:MAG: DUF4926 domain-containing protein [Oligoflexia bacterium]|nr:DUF4926 domain-containing protein [Oligoflexia bacterium]MBF0365024.1 DUF4926 domain-containing protein [Oligoflexia bacterium]
MKEYDVVVLNEDINESGLKKGMRGTIIEIFNTPSEEAYEVEFIDESSGKTIAITTLKPEQVTKCE